MFKRLVLGVNSYMKKYKKTKVFSNKSKLITLNSGVYGILDKLNKKIYIGSSNHIRKRYYDHASYLRNNKHWVKELQDRWNLLGRENFEFVVLEECFNYEEREDFYLQNNLDKRYNISQNIDSTGLKHTEESKQKIREARKNQIISPQAYKKAVQTNCKNNSNYYSEMGKLGQKKIKELGIIADRSYSKTEKFRKQTSIISKQIKRNKPHTIICEQTKETFATCGEAAEKLGLKSYKVIWKVLQGAIKSYNGFTFKYLDN